MITINAGVVAHQDRRERAYRLRDQLDEFYQTGIFLDDGRMGCDYNHLHAWDSITAGAEAEWCMVLEDDAVLDGKTSVFAYQLRQALNHAPSPIVSLYLGRGRPIHWQRRIENAMRFVDRPFIVTTHLLHCVGVCIRTEVAQEMLDDTRAAVDSSVHKPIDEAWTEAIQARNLPVAYTNPSLVDHADERSVAHQYTAAQPVRVAWRVGVRQSWQGQFSVM